MRGAVACPPCYCVSPPSAVLIGPQLAPCSQYGKNDHGMVLRHKNVELCAQSAWMIALFLNFHARNDDPPDFSSKKKWYLLAFSASKGDRTKHVAYQVRGVAPVHAEPTAMPPLAAPLLFAYSFTPLLISHRLTARSRAQTQADALNQLKRTMQLNISSVVHMFRHAAPGLASQHNVSHDSILRMGWNPAEVLCCVVLCCAVLRCSALRSAVLRCAALCCVALCCAK